MVRTAKGIVFPVAGVWTDGFPRRYSPEIALVLQAAAAYDYDEELKSCRHRAPADACVFGAPVKPTYAYAVWGDSHGLIMLRAIGSVAAQHGKSVKADISSGCPPVAGLDRKGKALDRTGLDRTGTDGGVIRIYPHKFLCDGKRCLVYDGEAILYHDTHHLTEAGAALVAPAFNSIFAGD